MKNILITILVTLLTSPVFAKDLVLNVNGLVCSFCAQGIEKKFKKDPRVADVAVDLKSKKVTLTLKPDSQIPEAELKKTLEDAGYTLVSIE